MQPADPFPGELRSARIRLRRYDPSDAQAVLRLIERNRERLIRNFPELAKGLRTAAEASAYIVARDRQWTDGVAFGYGIWASSESDPIGQIRLKNIAWDVPSAELSYFVDREWLRKGVATEAARTLLHEAFDVRGFKRLYVRVIATNEESLALARRLKFRHEGLHRSAFRCGLGELHDVHLFGITDADYRADEQLRAR